MVGPGYVPGPLFVLPLDTSNHGRVYHNSKEVVQVAKLTQYTNPISGKKGDILNVKQTGAMVLGGIVLLIVWGLAQRGLALIRAFAPSPVKGYLGQAAPTAPAPKGPTIYT